MNQWQSLYIMASAQFSLCLKEKFSFVSANSAHMTRGAASGNLVVPQPRTNSGKCMFSFTAAILFNALPLKIKQLVRTPLVSPNALISFSAFLSASYVNFSFKNSIPLPISKNFAALHAVSCFTAIAISPNRPSLLRYIVVTMLIKLLYCVNF